MIVIFVIKIFLSLSLKNFFVHIAIRMFVNYAAKIKGDFQKLTQNHIKYAIYVTIIYQILNLKKILKMILKEKNSSAKNFRIKLIFLIKN